MKSLSRSIFDSRSLEEVVGMYLLLTRYIWKVDLYSAEPGLTLALDRIPGLDPILFALRVVQDV
ncbi:hypothetical protein BH23ACT11_BH23ACT11_05090 [soil metagenome]